MIMDSNFSTFARISQESAFEGQWVVILDEKVVARGTARKIKEEMTELLVDAMVMVKKMSKRLYYYKNKYNDSTGNYGSNLEYLVGASKRRRLRKGRSL